MRRVDRHGVRIWLWALLSLAAWSLCGCLSRDLLEGSAGDGTDPDRLSQRTGTILLSTDGEPQVYLLLGLNDVYSLGLIELTDKINAAGIQATWLSGPDWPALGREIVDAHETGSLRGDLVFVGHSFGADDAVDLAQMLHEHSIPVRMLVLLDATDPSDIPPNVDRCAHFYLPNHLADAFPHTFAGNPVVAQPGNDHTEIINNALSSLLFGLEHFWLDSDPAIHDAVIAEILAYARRSG